MKNIIKGLSAFEETINISPTLFDLRELQQYESYSLVDILGISFNKIKQVGISFENAGRALKILSKGGSKANNLAGLFVFNKYTPVKDSWAIRMDLSMFPFKRMLIRHALNRRARIEKILAKRQNARRMR